MSEIERALRSASTAHGLSATGSLLREAADEITRLRTENQIRAQEYAALLGLWREQEARLEKAETVIAAARAMVAAVEYGFARTVEAKIAFDNATTALAQYDSHAEQKETT